MKSIDSQVFVSQFLCLTPMSPYPTSVVIVVDQYNDNK